MDVDEDSASAVASGRKRQKRTNSTEEDDESCSSRSLADADATTNMDTTTTPGIGKSDEVNVKVDDITVNSSGSNNNNNDSKQQEEAKTSTEAAAETSSTNTNPFLERRLPSGPSTSSSDDNDENAAATFNQRNIPRTRSYRRINIELDTDSNIFRQLDPEGVEEAVVDIEVADEGVRDGPPIVSSDDSSSSGSEIFQHGYYSSSGESDSTDETAGPYRQDADRELVDLAVNEAMFKDKPPYGWNFAQELLQREHNIINRIGWRGGHASAYSFGQGYYASRQVVEQMSLESSMSRHSGCVNCLNFNRAGDLICSGSDDLNIIVWDWANEKARHKFKSGHSMNIFQTKFIDSAGCLDIVSTSRDGQVRRAVIPPSGGTTKPIKLYMHSDSVHKIVVVPHSRHEVMSAGEDAAVKHFDLRTSTSATTMLRCDSSSRPRVRLFSIAHHPYAPEFCVSGSDDKLRVYDKRKLTKPVHEMTPQKLKDTKITQITCAVYNHSGSEILASYSDAGIYLYDSRNYKDGEFLHCYEGHINSRTIKGVNFFGPRSEYIVTGSDCGHIFFYDKNSEAIINYMKGDHAGVVNCLEPHPWIPVLATSGLEYDVKIWTPNGPHTSKPDADALKETLQRNFRRNILDTGDFDINQFHYFIRTFLQGSPANLSRARRNMRRGQAAANASGEEQAELEPDSSGSSSAISSPSSSPIIHRRSSTPDPEAQAQEDDEEAAGSDNMNTLHCRTQ